MTCLKCVFEYDDYTTRVMQYPVPGRFKNEE